MKYISQVLVFLSIIAGIANAQTARLQVIHNAADPAASMVDIYLNGEILLDNFAFRSATPYIDAPAGIPINIGVAAGNSVSAADTLKNFEVVLTEGETYVAIASGVLSPESFEANPDEVSTGFTLFIKANAREAATSDNVDFFVLHGATDAPTVDVVARGVATLVDDAAYGAITDYITVPAGSYTLDVTPGSDNETVVASYTADLSGLAGGAAVVFASGFLSPDNDQDGAAFGLFAALPTGDVAVFAQVVTSIESAGEFAPSHFSLEQNYPNPFNPETNIEFSIPSNQNVTLTVFDVTGRQVAELVNENLAAGRYNFNFDARMLSSGVYFYRLQTENFTQIRRMTLLK
jgi:hypothetical protein